MIKPCEKADAIGFAKSSCEASHSVRNLRESSEAEGCEIDLPHVGVNISLIGAVDAQHPSLWILCSSDPETYPVSVCTSACKSCMAIIYSFARFIDYRISP